MIYQKPSDETSNTTAGFVHRLADFNSHRYSFNGSMSAGDFDISRIGF